MQTYIIAAAYLLTVCHASLAPSIVKTNVVKVNLNSPPFDGQNSFYLDRYKTNTITVDPAEDTLHDKQQPISSVLIENQTLPYLHRDFIADLPEAMFITIKSSGLKEIMSGSFRNIPHLSSLDLSNNAIEIIEDETFSGLRDPPFADRSLFLALSYNKISIIRDNAFKNLPIHGLNLDHNRISAWNGDWFMGTFLIMVSISNNLLEEIPSDAFSFHRNQTEEDFDVVEASDNKIRKISAKAFAGIKNLSHLELQNNLIEIIEPGAFDGVKNIDYLTLNNNSLSKIIGGVFNEVSIGDVSLSNNKLKCFRPSDIKVERRIELKGNLFYCNCVEIWKKWTKLHKKEHLIYFSDMEDGCIEPLDELKDFISDKFQTLEAEVKKFEDFTRDKLQTLEAKTKIFEDFTRDKLQLLETKVTNLGDLTNDKFQLLESKVKNHGNGMTC